ALAFDAVQVRRVVPGMVGRGDLGYRGGRAQVSCSLAGASTWDVVKVAFATFNVAEVAFATSPSR
ncbi:hypothetical protein, partial [Amycolatopsis thailandensis]|uniref:hypothetical protein n=1 Tax=Amycolatopsis thailandensis TaxID=589330 RepID=UPI003642A84C